MKDFLIITSVISIVFMPFTLVLNKRKPVLNLFRLGAESIVYGFFGLSTIVAVLLNCQLMGKYTLYVSLLFVFFVPLGIFLSTKRSTLQLNWKPNWITVCLLVTLGGGVFLRQNPSYYLFMTGDMGQYINVANYAVNGGHQLFAGFLHMFTAMFVVSNYFLGPSGTVAILPVIGFTAVVALILFLSELGVRSLGLLTATAFSSFGLMPVWYSKFPVSEILYSFQLVFIYFLLAKCRHEVRWTHVLAIFLAFWQTAMTRGNIFFTAITLLPFFVVFAHSTGVRSSRRIALVLAPFVGLFCAYVYNVEKVTKVFVKIYLNKYLGSLFDILSQHNLINFSWQLIGLAVAAGLSLTIILWTYGKLHDRLKISERIYALSLVVISLCLLFGFRSTNRLGLIATADYFDWILVYTAGLGILTILLKSKRYKSVFAMFFVAIITAILYSKNIEQDRTHIHFLYYQRYTFPEIYWSLIGFAGIGIHESAFLLQKVFPRRTYKSIIIVFGLLGIGIISYRGIQRNRPHLNKTILQGAYEQLAEIDSQMTRANDPVFFSGFSQSTTTPKNWFFPNMFRSYMFPLFYTFHRELALSMPEDAFQKDPISTPESIFLRLKEMGKTSGYLVVVNRETDEALPENLWNQPVGVQHGVRWKLLKTIEKDILNASHPERFEDIKFYEIPVRAQVFDVTLVADK